MKKKTAAGLLSTVIMISVLIGGCSRATDQPLTLLSSVPWGNTRKAEYEIDNGNQAVGTAEIDIQKLTTSNAYKITKVRRIGDDKKVQSGATVHADTLMPVESFYEQTSHDETPNQNNFTIDIRTSYAEKWNVRMVTSGKEKDIDVKLPGVCYDNESLLVILGALANKEGRAFKLNDAIPLTGKVETMSGKAEGQETIAVPYGKAECEKIELGSMRFWYSADKDRILYQYKDGDTTFKLKNLTRN